MDVGALGYESVGFLKQSAAPKGGVHLQFFLYLYIKIIVLSEDVNNYIYVSLRVDQLRMQLFAQSVHV